MSRLILALAVLALVVAPALAGSTIVLAHGDNLDFYEYTTPTNQTEQYRVWIFAGRDQFYGIDFTSNVNQCHIVIPDSMLNSLPEGSYPLYIQFQGPNRQFDVTYGKNRLQTIYKAIPDATTLAVEPRMVQQAFDLMLATSPVDDPVYKYTLEVQHPAIKVRNMYNMADGSLHIDLTTNLASGDPIWAIIDEETYQVPYYKEMMSYRTTVGGIENRTFSLEFPRKVADQLTAGTHIISVHFQADGVTTIPFHRYERYVEPTPVPVVEKYYSFSGEMLGYDINTTPPAPSNVTIVPTYSPVYETKLIETRLNNRTIGQRDVVYVGEKNLDVFGALGWQSSNTSGYYFQIQWCDGDGEVVTIKNPEHYDIDEETYRSRHGGWCQYNPNLNEKNPPVAFFVRRNPGLNWTDGNETINAMRKNQTTVQVNLSGVLTNLTIYNDTTVTPTMPWDSANTTATAAVNETTPIPVPTTESITLPVPAAIPLLGIVLVMLWRRR